MNFTTGMIAIFWESLRTKSFDFFSRGAKSSELDYLLVFDAVSSARLAATQDTIREIVTTVTTHRG